MTRLSLVWKIHFDDREIGYFRMIVITSKLYSYVIRFIVVRTLDLSSYLELQKCPIILITFFVTYNLLSQQIERLIGFFFSRYCPTRLWGYSGHIQTIIQGFISRLYCPLVNGRRQSFKAADGATVTYDIYQPIEQHIVHCLY